MTRKVQTFSNLFRLWSAGDRCKLNPHIYSTSSRLNKIRKHLETSVVLPCYDAPSSASHFQEPPDTGDPAAPEAAEGEELTLELPVTVRRLWWGW